MRGKEKENASYKKSCLAMRRMTFMNFVYNMMMNYFFIHELRGSSHKQCIMWKVVSIKNINKKQTMS
jgi:hypothetical protein